VAADSKITLDVLRRYLNCRYLAHLLLGGQAGVKSEYEIVRAELEQAVRLKVMDRLRSKYSDQSLVTGVVLAAPLLARAPLLFSTANYPVIASPSVSTG
jgi:hypothetical protein